MFWNTILSQRIFEKLLKTCINVLKPPCSLMALYIMEKGVLQEDCFSQFMFNLIINTFNSVCWAWAIWTVCLQTYEMFNSKSRVPICRCCCCYIWSWKWKLIFLKLFSRWWSWAEMVMRLDKCLYLRIKKSGTSSKQYEPELFVNNDLIPPGK